MRHAMKCSELGSKFKVVTPYDVGCISNEQMMGKKIWMDIKVNIKEKPDKQKRLHDREWLPKPKCWQTMILDYAEVARHGNVNLKG